MVLMLLIQAGGVGFMMLAVFMLLVLGRKISLADRLALQDSLGLNLPRAVVRIAGRTVKGILVIEGIGALLLWIHWTPLLGASKALWYGIFHAVSAFCNAGFDLWTGTPGYRRHPHRHVHTGDPGHADRGWRPGHPRLGRSALRRGAGACTPVSR